MVNVLILDMLVLVIMTILGFLIGLFMGVYLAARKKVDYSPKWAELENLDEVKAVMDFLHDYRIANNDVRHEREPKEEGA